MIIQAISGVYYSMRLRSSIIQQVNVTQYALRLEQVTTGERAYYLT